MFSYWPMPHHLSFLRSNIAIMFLHATPGGVCFSSSNLYWNFCFVNCASLPTHATKN